MRHEATKGWELELGKDRYI